jgi:hypothetical protein
MNAGDAAQFRLSVQMKRAALAPLFFLVVKIVASRRPMKPPVRDS